MALFFFFFFHKVMPLVVSHLLCLSSWQAVLCTDLEVRRESLTWIIFWPETSELFRITPECKMRSDWVSYEAREKKPSGSVLDGYTFFTYTSPDNHLRVLFTANSDCPDVRQNRMSSESILWLMELTVFRLWGVCGEIGGSKWTWGTLECLVSWLYFGMTN